MNTTNKSVPNTTVVPLRPAANIKARAGSDGQSRSILPAPMPAFDYNTVPADKADALRQQAKRIRDRIKATTEAVIEIGRDLLAVKQNLAHGQFTKWVQAECGFSLRAAQNYIKAAKFAEGKKATVALLAPAIVYMLASKTTPPAIVDWALQRVDSDIVVSEQEIDGALAEARAQKREAKCNFKRSRAWKKKKQALDEQARQNAEVRQQKDQHDADAAALAIIDIVGDKKALLVGEIFERRQFIFSKILKSLRQHQRGAVAAMGGGA